MKKLIIFITLLFTSLFVDGQFARQKETYYRDIFVKNFATAKTEVVLPDMTRADIVTDTFAIEVDFGDKWAESIGQSLYYAKQLDKKPGVLLVIDIINDDRFVQRLMTVAAFHGIKVWVMDYSTLIYRRVTLGYYYSYD